MLAWALNSGGALGDEHETHGGLPDAMRAQDHIMHTRRAAHGGIDIHAFRMNQLRIGRRARRGVLRKQRGAADVVVSVHHRLQRGKHARYCLRDTLAARHIFEAYPHEFSEFCSRCRSAMPPGPSA